MTEIAKYANLQDLINKRESFIAGMQIVHLDKDKLAKINKFELYAYLNEAADRVKQKSELQKSLVELLNIYDRILTKLLKKLDSIDISRAVCYNNLFLSNIYRYADNSIGVYPVDNVGVNDPAWDYATILARSSDQKNYVTILNNNSLVNDVAIKYQDDNLRIRILINMMFVDILDIFKLELEPYYILNFAGNAHTQQLLLDRVLNFINNSYTSIEYFEYIYK